jgi:hypothetical protein
MLKRKSKFTKKEKLSKVKVGYTGENDGITVTQFTLLLYDYDIVV